MNLIKTVTRLLILKLTHDEMLRFNRKHFVAGLMGTWVVGIGRYWDDTEASFVQHLGLGSVIYIFVLAAFIWLIIKPFFIENWNYFTVVTFIGLTSFPALLYAIPVEMFVSIQTANSINVWFLAIVAIWRLLLLNHFLKRFTKLSYTNIVIVTLLPICLIISALTALNLHKVVFNIMGGIRDPNAHEASYSVLLFLTVISVILSLPLLLAYSIGVYNSYKKRQAKK